MGSSNVYLLLPIPLDYLIRLHLANNDSSHNEVERCQSYVGDAICDGGPLNWEYKKLLCGETSEELSKTRDRLKSLTLEEFQVEETQRMRYNAGKVCEDVATRINGAPAPGGYMTGTASWNRDLGAAIGRS